MSVTPDSWVRLPCGCHASQEGADWRIEAVAFLCDEYHGQGDLVPWPVQGGAEEPSKLAEGKAQSDF